VEEYGVGVVNCSEVVPLVNWAYRFRIRYRSRYRPPNSEATAEPLRAGIEPTGVSGGYT
jgi:hypothetical protein